MISRQSLFGLVACFTIGLFVVSEEAFSQSKGEGELSVLFLGDNGHHKPKDLFLRLEPVLSGKGIKVDYTDKPTDLTAENLARFDALLLYANIDRIEPSQEKALLDYVAKGGGFVPLHCATFCFRNSDEVVALMGA